MRLPVIERTWAAVLTAVIASVGSGLASAASAQLCVGDCNGDGRVAVNELMAGVGLALSGSPANECAAMDANRDGTVAVYEVVAAVNSALDGCAVFTALSVLPEWPAGAQAYSLSPDGTVLVGTDAQQAIRWMDGHTTVIAPPSGTSSATPVAASQDGAVVVGQTYGVTQGFRWQGGRFLELAAAIYPTDVSADGSVVAGYRANGRGGNVASRWANGVLTDLGYLQPNTHSEAWAISADGSTVVGFGQYSTDGVVVDEAFRWKDGEMLGLGGLLAGDRLYSSASDVSADGSVVVGTTRGATGLEAFRWTDGSMTGLGVLPGYQESVGQTVSGDGRLVFGRCQKYADESEFFTAFVWEHTHGMRRLEDVLHADFALVLTGWSLEQVISTSGDGLTIVGGGTNPEGRSDAWIARLRQPVSWEPD